MLTYTFRGCSLGPWAIFCSQLHCYKSKITSLNAVGHIHPCSSTRTERRLFALFLTCCRGLRCRQGQALKQLWVVPCAAIATLGLAAAENHQGTGLPQSPPSLDTIPMTDPTFGPPHLHLQRTAEDPCDPVEAVQTHLCAESCVLCTGGAVQPLCAQSGTCTEVHSPISIKPVWKIRSRASL